KIAVCSSCKTEKNHRFPSALTPVPDEINSYNQTHAVIHLSPSSPFPEPLPMARLPTQSICDTSSLNHHSSILTNSQPPSLVVPNNDFPIEYNNPDIEALVFPDIFPGSCGHYEDVKRLLKFRHNTDSYGKYIKLRTLCSNPRFRLHWYWPHWSYLNLEKKCNKNRILNQKNVNHELHPTRADLISRSTYDNQPMINEALTTTLPSSIQTSEAFFRKNQHHVNTMVQGYGLPQIFYTMTMPESKWKHLQEILLLTDNHDLLPSNRPLHAYLHYHNRGSIHTHGFAYTEKKTPDLIAKNTICADITDPFLEPGLFQLMTMYQIHRCVGEKCGDPGTNANPCKKGFPRPLSNFTYSEQNSKRYIYQRTKDEDHWEIGINGTDDIAVAVFNNKVFIGGSILPSAPSELRI
ncbi:12424_t:CDS:2, partial [Entrophospora sp. SA101]